MFLPKQCGVCESPNPENWLFPTSLAKNREEKYSQQTINSTFFKMPYKIFPSAKLPLIILIPNQFQFYFRRSFSNEL